MRHTINLNYNDVQRILSIMERFHVDDKTVRLVHESFGIGYAIDLEFEQQMSGELVTVTVPIATTDNW
jgi:hypothetical protein